MRVLVGVKRVIDFAVKVRVAPDKMGKPLRGANLKRCGAVAHRLDAMCG